MMNIILPKKLRRCLTKKKFFFASGLTLLAIILYLTFPLKSYIKMVVKNNIKSRIITTEKAENIQNKSPHILIEIGEEEMKKITDIRYKAFELGYIPTDSTNEYLPAKIKYQDELLDVDLKLKGNFLDHVNSPNRWSYRIKVKNNENLLGMTNFSIQKPSTRNGLGEWLFMEMLDRENILHPWYEFMLITINGDKLGAFAIEERFNSRLLENKKYRAGPIIRFQDDLFFLNKTNYNNTKNEINTLDWSTNTYPIIGYETDEFLKNEVLQKQFIRAVSLLEGFRNRTLKASNVFDINKLAKFYALTDITGSYHALQGGNLRYYYNPITALLEPIGYDANAFIELTYLFGEEMSLEFDNVYKQKRYEHRLNWLIEDPIFAEKYFYYLDQFSREEYSKKLFKDMDAELIKRLRLLNDYDPEYRYQDFNRMILINNQKYIQYLLNPIKGVHAYFLDAENGQLRLRIGNIQYLPIEILYVENGNSKIYPKNREILLPRHKDKPIDYKEIVFHHKTNSLPQNNFDSLKIFYKIPGINKEMNAEIYTWDNYKIEYSKPTVIQKPSNVQNFKFIIQNDENKTIIVKNGDWTLKEPLIIPSGYTFAIDAGTKINLENQSFIVSRSPIYLRGEENSPIIIDSLDNSGQGFLILNTGSKSYLKYTIFKNMNFPKTNEWEITGTVTFYQSPVSCEYCEFIGNKAEDTLNIIASDFDLSNIYIEDSQGDAIDIDFSKGTIQNSMFSKCGNDCIDTSNSNIELLNTIINRAGDKGISIGETSSANINNLEINKSSIGIAAKDLSLVNIENITISDTDIAFAIYQKKAEFGPAEITISDKHPVKITNYKDLYRLENGSKLILNGGEQKPNTDKTEDQLK